MNQNKKIKVAILGSGNIGTDLLVKIQRSSVLFCSMFIGRNQSSPGMQKALQCGVTISDQSIQAIVNDPDCCDLVFDATSALDHKIHWPILKNLGKAVIDLTPSRIGTMIVPAVNLSDSVKNSNVNMISCGGQASIPLAYAVTQVQADVEYIEVVSSIASPGAGPATRINIDEYIETTEDGIKRFSRCEKVKTILILNPADPRIDMQTTLSVKVKNPDMESVRSSVVQMVERIQRYVPGYTLFVPPVYEQNRIVIMVRVKGLGDYLPAYAGNLDIINCAAIATAEAYATRE